MLDPANFRELVSGQRRGVLASITRAFLRLCEIPYTWAVRLRNSRYDQKPSKTQQVNVPVVSVGNLTMGGTGKTPMVQWLANWFRQRGVDVALVSRGYGSKDGKPNDEAMELAKKLPGVPHLQDPDRVAAAQKAIAEYQCQAIVLDDGFQHRRIHRDLDIVLLDALEPFGFGHVFPRGVLREPLSGLRRADIAALSRADVLSQAQREEIHQRVREIAPNIIWLELVHQPCSLLGPDGSRTDVKWLQGKRIAAFCGIGNPQGFRHTLQTCGCEVVDFRTYPDHHPYSATDVEELTNWTNGLADIDVVLCTHKDLVKIDASSIGPYNLKALEVGVVIEVGEDDLTDKLQLLWDKNREKLARTNDRDTA